MSSEGKKYDAGKPMIGTIIRIFPRALSVIGAVIEYGTHKYPDPDNWSKNEHITERYTESIMRHLAKFFMGKFNDEESGLPHLAHVAWNALAILEYEMRNRPEFTNQIIYPEEVRND